MVTRHPSGVAYSLLGRSPKYRSTVPSSRTSMVRLPLWSNMSNASAMAAAVQEDVDGDDSPAAATGCEPTPGDIGFTVDADDGAATDAVVAVVAAVVTAGTATASAGERTCCPWPDIVTRRFEFFTRGFSQTFGKKQRDRGLFRVSRTRAYWKHAERVTRAKSSDRYMRTPPPLRKTTCTSPHAPAPAVVVFPSCATAA